MEESKSLINNRLKVLEALNDKSLGDIETRNKLIDSGVLVESERYRQFILNLGADKQRLDAVTDLAQLFLSVAGTLAGGIQSKENLAAASSLVAGSKTAIDKHFYFDQTLPALISTMNNRRKEVMLRIIRGRAADIRLYPSISAVGDLNELREAGTLRDAIETVQGQATTEKDNLDRELKSILPATEGEIRRSGNVNLTVAQLGRDNTSLAKINSALKILGKKSDYTLHKDAYEALERIFRDPQGPSLTEWEKALGINSN